MTLTTPKDLEKHCLLYDDSYDWWHHWFETVVVGRIEPRKTEMVFSHDRLYEAALEGQRVLMREAMVYSDDLANGRFVHLFDQTLEGNQFILAVRSPAQRRALDSFVA